MKLVIAGIALILTGCAVQPMSFEQRMAVANYMQHSRYVLPTLQPMNVPQTHSSLCYLSGNYVSCSGN